MFVSLTNAATTPRCIARGSNCVNITISLRSGRAAHHPEHRSGYVVQVGVAWASGVLNTSRERTQDNYRNYSKILNFDSC